MEPDGIDEEVVGFSGQESGNSNRLWLAIERRVALGDTTTDRCAGTRGGLRQNVDAWIVLSVQLR